MKLAEPPEPVKPTYFEAMGAKDGRIVTATLDELWKTAPRARTRI